jgi:hypothetical protein
MKKYKFYAANLRGIILNGAQYVTLKTYFRHPSLVILLFRNPAQKAGTAYRWEPTNNKPLGRIIMIGANGTNNHTVFSKCTPWVRLSPAAANCEIMLSQNHVLSQTGTF